MVITFGNVLFVKRSLFMEGEFIALGTNFYIPLIITILCGFGLIFQLQTLRIINYSDVFENESLDDFMKEGSKKKKRRVSIFLWIGEIILTFGLMFMVIAIAASYLERYPLNELPENGMKYIAPVLMFGLLVLLLIDLIMVKRFLKKNQNHLLKVSEN
jgi:hypothetical protein